MGFRILFVDEEFAPDTHEYLGSYMSYYALELCEHGHSVVRCDSGDDVLPLLESCEFDLVLIDIMTPSGRMFSSEDTLCGLLMGIPLTRLIHLRYPNLRIIILSNATTRNSSIAELVAQGIVERVLFKPDTMPQELVEIVEAQHGAKENA